jgi:VIT1/CCC1 family predicted Fe2+/Mn2+ transporter
MATHVHRSHRTGWLRAGVLGANDGILSISSLVLGVASAHRDPHDVLLAGVAGLVAGILSMGAGEYVSVSSQADTERADLAIERHALRHEYGQEQAELAAIYVRRGLDPETARRVARQLMEHDALDAHARDEIGISATLSARPLQAALASAASFAVGGMVPLLVAFVVHDRALVPVTATVSLACLVVLGAAAARAGGASIWVGAGRVVVWGALAMAVTAGAGALFGAVV